MTTLELQHDLLKRIIYINDTAMLMRLKEFIDSSPKDKIPSPHVIKQLFGSWKSDKTSDTIIQEIYDSRVNQTHEVIL